VVVVASSRNVFSRTPDSISLERVASVMMPATTITGNRFHIGTHAVSKIAVVSSLSQNQTTQIAVARAGRKK
jgi:hypothetical protein